VVYAEDVTEQVTREAEEQQERLRLLIENVEGVALGLYDAQTTRLLHANSRFLELSAAASGVPGDRVPGSTWEELTAGLLGKKETERMFSMVLDGREAARQPEVRLTIPPDKRESVWHYYLVPVPQEHSTHVRYVAASAIEVTDQVHAREELEQVDQLKDVFLSLASHELRTPLVPLTGYADMLSRLVARKDKENPPGWDSRISEYTSKFQGQLRHLTRLVEDLFDVARIESGKLALDRKEVDLVRVVNHAIEHAGMLSSRHKINCTIEEKDRPLVVLGDEDRLIQLVGNLLQNAIKYAPNSRKIDMRLHRETQDSDRREMAIIEVRDHGPGIAEEDIQSIFTRFYQATNEGRSAEGGLGLGLFISKGIVEQHGGTITVTSTVGKGSTFKISLPLANNPQSEDDAGA
jgi:signal transduction histidine kinase